MGKDLIKKSFLLAIALLSLVVVTGCRSTAPTSDSANQAANGQTIAIVNYAFAPKVLTVKVGDTITWANNDTAPHTVKSSLFESPRLSRGQTFQYVFSQAGAYDYICGLHPTMKGQIIVQP